MINGKREIAFSAAQVAYGYFALRKLALDIPNHFYKAVYLTEFELFFVVYSSVFVGNAEELQKRLGAVENVLFFDIIFLNAYLIYTVGKQSPAELALSDYYRASRF